MNKNAGNTVSNNQKPIIDGQISDGSIEAIKWVAILFMTIDHINSNLIYTTTGQFYPVLFNIGRIAFPLFALVLAYNLARPRSAQDEKKAIIGVLNRLLLFGVVSLVPYYLATDGLILPLNIMFTLAVATAIIYVIHLGTERKRRISRYAIYFLAHSLFVITAPFVDYSLYGVSLIVMAWLFFRYTSVIALVLMCVLTFCLYAINETHWALLALPIFGVSYFVNMKVPRINQRVYYIYYPAHLAIIAGLAAAYRWLF